MMKKIKTITVFKCVRCREYALAAMDECFCSDKNFEIPAERYIPFKILDETFNRGYTQALEDVKHNKFFREKIQYLIILEELEKLKAKSKRIRGV